ncbi:MAG: hypothetical protein ABIO44_12715, partial [Saprospiraceae bacterium]
MSKLIKLVCVAFFLGNYLFSQTDSIVIIDNSKVVDTVVIKENITTVAIPADTVITTIEIDNSELALYKSGKTKYAPKPRDVWEVGAHTGIFLLSGDVDQRHFIPGIGYGLHIRRAIHYIFSLRLDAIYSMSYGLDPQPSSSGLDPEQFYQVPGGALRPVFNGYGSQNPWFANYKLTMYSLSVQGILNVGNILFHKPTNKWNWYVVLGLGGYTNKTMLNLRDANNNIYTNLIAQSNYNNLDFNTTSGRKQIKKNLDAIYDNSYETESYVKKGIFRLNDKINV